MVFVIFSHLFRTIDYFVNGVCSLTHKSPPIVPFCGLIPGFRFVDKNSSYEFYLDLCFKTQPNTISPFLFTVISCTFVLLNHNSKVYKLSLTMQT